MADFNKAIPIILAHEGGWVDDPADPGGETNFGWSMRTIKALGLSPRDLGIDQDSFTPGSMKLAKKSNCEALYKKYFWDKYGYGNIVDDTAATKVMDSSVNMGGKRAGKLAQQACNRLGSKLLVDGNLGPKSYAAINSYDPQEFINAFGSEMSSFYQGLVSARPSMGKFLKGWLKRANWGVK